MVKFISSEKATVDLSYVLSASQIYGGDFARFCGVLRIYELYRQCAFSLVKNLDQFFLTILTMSVLRGYLTSDGKWHFGEKNCIIKNIRLTLPSKSFHISNLS